MILKILPKPNNYNNNPSTRYSLCGQEIQKFYAAVLGVF
jgi:hypothetical protein